MRWFDFVSIDKWFGLKRFKIIKIVEKAEDANILKVVKPVNYFITIFRKIYI